MSDVKKIPKNGNGSVARGVSLGLLLHFLQLLLVPGLMIAIGYAGPGGGVGLFYLVYAWGVTQFLYLGPAAWLAFRRGERETGKGILYVAGIGILLNGACDLIPNIRNY